MKKNLVIGTRGSRLALWQANHIADAIRTQYPSIEVAIVRIVTTGDRILDVPLAKIGGKGLFTKELEIAMMQGEIDLAVHSLKDMPTELPVGLMLAAVTQRENPGDAFISPRFLTLDALPNGARVGTSSLRRRAQLLHYRPDLLISDLRGNLDTRLSKVKTQELDAIILAVSGLKRLGWEEEISQVLPHSICLPAVGQGALAIEARQNDTEVLELLSFLNHQETRAAVFAERAFLRVIEGGCQVPVGVYGEIAGQSLCLSALIASVDGQTMLKDQVCGDAADGEELGYKLAEKMLAAGGREILAALEDFTATGGNRIEKR